MPCQINICKTCTSGIFLSEIEHFLLINKTSLLNYLSDNETITHSGFFIA